MGGLVFWPTLYKLYPYPITGDRVRILRVDYVSTSRLIKESIDVSLETVFMPRTSEIIDLLLLFLH